MNKGRNMNERITEQVVVDKIIEFMINKENGNWHEEKVKKVNYINMVLI
jgi:hypothetical protein